MKKFLLSTVAVLAVAISPAVAADLMAQDVAPVATPVSAPAITWTGPYFGVSVGGYRNDGDDDDFSVCDEPSDAGDVDFGDADGDTDPVAGETCDGADFGFTDPLLLDDSLTFESIDGDDGEDEGVLAGAHLGYNFQAGNFVIGAEGAVKFLFNEDDDEEESRFLIEVGDGDAGEPDAAGTLSLEDGSTDWLGLATLRAGPLLGERTLVYVKGGLAFSDDSGGGLDGECPFVEAPVTECSVESDDDGDEWNTGWTIGGGIEHKFTQNFSIGLEYAYVDLNNDDDKEATVRYLDPGLPVGSQIVELPLSVEGGSDNLHLVELRATFQFGGGL